jgi:hypothetical protein
MNDELIQVGNPEELLPEYNWKDCSAVFVCENGNWKCTTSQFYQGNHCGFMPEEPEEGHTGNPLEGYMSPVHEEVVEVNIDENKRLVQEEIAQMSQPENLVGVLADAGGAEEDALTILGYVAAGFAIPFVFIVIVEILWKRIKK